MNEARAEARPKVGSIWLSEWGYVKVAAVQDGVAYVHRCTVNGVRVGSQPSVMTNLGWFAEWPHVIDPAR